MIDSFYLTQFTTLCYFSVVLGASHQTQFLNYHQLPLLSVSGLI